ncbi:MAG TPA: DUF5134 domain-containing protein, partial [Acidimicrobiales bacterium]|nr:DUF5134 domain-containing protein [Acidimicrobiales bacterium]
MPGNPTWLYYLLAVLMVAVAIYCFLLLVSSLSTGRTVGRDVEIAHVLMGVAMAGMFVPAWAFGPTGLWVLAFVALLLWFGVRAVQSIQRWGLHVPHTAIHAVMSFAMLLMYWFPMASSSGAMSMSSSGGARMDPGLALIVTFVLFGSAIFTIASPHRGASHFGTHEPVHHNSSGPAGHPGSATATLTGTDRLVGNLVLVDATH